MPSRVDHIDGRTFHGRKGEVENAFTYSIDYVLLDAEAEISAPRLFGRNRRALTSLWDLDHGGTPKEGQGAAWVRKVLEAHGHAQPSRIEILARPRVFGHVFNPVSFWLCRDAQGGLRAVISEVTNTFGERHSYLVSHPDGSVITAHDTLKANKIFYVSPFQAVEGGYTFRFDIRPDKIGVWIDYSATGQGVLATLTGTRRSLTNRAILKACFRRPFGSRRVLTLIHWQALKLWWKGARYRVRPKPPTRDLS